VHNILTNPVYAGAYAFGRTMSKVSVENGRKRVKRGLRRPLAEWDVLLKKQHERYISWSEFERNRQVIADNATGKGSATVRGAVRRGELLLAGLLRWSHQHLKNLPLGFVPTTPLNPRTVAYRMTGRPQAQQSHSHWNDSANIHGQF